MNSDSAKLDLLILDQLVEPTESALAVLADIGEELTSRSPGPVSLAGLYVLAVSQLEIAIADTLRYILKRNPWRMGFAKIENTREELLSSELVRELLESHAEDLVRGWSYGSKTDLFKRFVQVANLPETLPAPHADTLAELSDRRNDILHRARPQPDFMERSKVWVFSAETQQCVERLVAILRDVRVALTTRYAQHSRVEVLRRLWSYLFQSPVMRFDDYWTVDASIDRVFMKASPPVEMLASSERMLLGLWRAEFAGDASLLREFNMKRLDSKRRRDVVTLIAALRDIWLY